MLNIENEIRRYERVTVERVRDKLQTKYLLEEYQKRILNPNTTEQDKIVMNDSLIPMARWKLRYLDDAIKQHQVLLDHNRHECEIVEDNVKCLRQELYRVDAILQYYDELRKNTGSY